MNSFRFLVIIGLIIVLSVILGSVTLCQSKKNVEVSAGLGIVFPSEDSPLNLKGETSLKTSWNGNASIRWPIGDLMFVGLRGFLSVQKLSNYQIQPTGSETPKDIEFRLTSYTFAVDSKVYLIDSRHIAPYLIAAIAYSGGSISSGDLGNLSYQGFSAGGGVGIRAAITRKISASIEALHLFGKGKWKEKPSSNSFSDEYDPSCTYLSAIVNFYII